MAKRLINPIIDAVDVDGVVQRIDVNKLLERIDINHLIDRIDLDRQLQRVDWNAVMDRVDVNRIIDRSNLDAIIARSSAGVCGNCLDSTRARIVTIDQAFQRFGHLRCCKKKFYLPPRPGIHNKEKVEFPENLSGLAVLVQGRYSGVLSRIFSYCVDFFFMWSIFMLFVVLVQFIMFLLNADYEIDVGEAQSSIEFYWRIVIVFSYMLLFQVSFLSAFRQTPGMAMLGLKLVREDGSRVGFIRVCIRQFIEGVCTIFVAPQLAFLVFAWLRYDGRTPTDLVTQTGIVFSWDAQMARLRNPSMMDEMEAV